MAYSRRRALLATGAVLGLAGCVDEFTGDDDTPTDGNGNGSGSDDVEYDVFQLGPSLARPLWATVEDATGFVARLDAEDDRVWMVEDPDEVDGLRSWLDETDFSRSAIVYVETAGPNTCYSELDVGDVAVEDDTLVGTAEAVDTSDGNGACGAAETHPSAFVRVTGDDLPDGTTFAVTDGWGESSEVAADGRYAEPENLPGHVRPDGDPAKLRAFSCDDERFERHWGPEGDVALGEAHGDDDELTFAMRVHATQALAAGDEGSPRVGRGHEVRITMWNVSTEMQYTGNRHKWNLQVLTTDGWQDVRGTPDGEPLGYTDEAIEHRPGEGFEWSIEMTQSGVLEGHVHEDRLEVCPDLQQGRYRFVHREAGDEPLAVEFDYED